MSLISLFQKDASPEDRRRIRRILILGGTLLGIFCLLLGGTQLASKPKEEPSTVYSPTEDEMILYQNYLEGRIEELCRSVKGVSNVTAVVTLSGSFSTVYATEWKDGNEEYVILGSGSSAEALPLSRAAPTIDGIGIVCTGGGNPTLASQLSALLAASFHVPTNRIYVVEGK